MKNVSSFNNFNRISSNDLTFGRIFKGQSKTKTTSYKFVIFFIEVRLNTELLIEDNESFMNSVSITLFIN